MHIYYGEIMSIEQIARLRKFAQFIMLRIFRELRDKMISLKDIAQIVRLRIFKQLHKSDKVFPPNEYCAIYANAHSYMIA